MKLDRTIIKSLSLFDKMTDDELDALLVPAQTRRLPIGESVFEQGQPASYFFLLLHGRLKVTQRGVIVFHSTLAADISR